MVSVTGLTEDGAWHQIALVSGRVTETISRISYCQVAAVNFQRSSCPLGYTLLAALALCITIVFAAPSTLATAATNKDAVAVIIGNKDYAGSVPDVDFAHNDANAMKRFVVEVLGFREGNIIDLRDAGQAEMEAAFGNERSHKGKLWRWSKPGKSDVVVFYSGHGVPGLEDKRGYLLPVNADPARRRSTAIRWMCSMPTSPS